MKYFEDFKIEENKSIYIALAALTFLFTIYALSIQPISVFETTGKGLLLSPLVIHHEILHLLL
jgi:hypothetical protein